MPEVSYILKIRHIFIYSGILSVGPIIETSSTMLLQTATDSARNNQKWIFNADGTIRSLDGWTLTIYQYTDGEHNQLIGAENVVTPTALQLFNVIPF
jgi:hypothetical protein